MLEEIIQNYLPWASDAATISGYARGLKGQLTETVLEEICSAPLDERSKVSLFDVINLVEKGVTGEAILKLVRAQVESNGTLFTEFDINELEPKIDVVRIIEISRIFKDRSDSFRNIYMASEISKMEISAEHTSSLCSLQCSNGKLLFTTMSAFRLAIDSVKSPKVIPELFRCLQTYNFDNLEKNFSSIVSTISTVDELTGWLNLKDDHGDFIFRRGSDLVDFVTHNGTSEKALQLCATSIAIRGRSLNGFEVTLLHEQQFSDQEVRILLLKPGSLITNIMRSKMGVENDDFTFDGRPRAYIFLPEADPTGILGERVFSEHCGVSLLRTIARHYDIKIECIGSEEDFTSKFDTAIDPALVWIAGHGSKNGTTLGEDLRAYGIERTPESLVLTDQSKFFLEKIAQLSSRCTLVLDSCATAEGGAGAENFATSISQAAPHVRIIAMKEPFSPKSVSLRHINPISINALSLRSREDTIQEFGPGSEYPTSFPWEDGQGEIWDSVEGVQLIELSSSPQKENLTELYRRLALNTYPVVYPELIAKYQKQIGKLKGVTLLQQEPYELPWNHNSSHFVFGECLSEPWCPLGGEYSASALLFGATDYCLQKQGYERISNPEDGDIVVYVKPHFGDKLDHLQTSLFGIMRNGKVLTRYPGGSIFSSELDLVPDQLGRAVSFYRKKLLSIV